MMQTWRDAEELIVVHADIIPISEELEKLVELMSGDDFHDRMCGLEGHPLNYSGYLQIANNEFFVSVWNPHIHPRDRASLKLHPKGASLNDLMRPDLEKNGYTLSFFTFVFVDRVMCIVGYCKEGPWEHIPTGQVEFDPRISVGMSKQEHLQKTFEILSFQGKTFPWSLTYSRR
ncbi:hypothetical protein KKH43_04725 [Patescibacteria group bacterium]|nr:hypothetical protein [Patescibacteria group bacterium]